MALEIDRIQLEIVIQKDEARQKMIELEQQMRDANKELTKIGKTFGKNSEEYRNQVDELKGLQQQYDKIFEDIGVGSLSLKELQNRQKELNQIIRNIPGDDSLYAPYKNQLDEINARIKELKGDTNEYTLYLNKLAESYGTMLHLERAGANGTDRYAEQVQRIRQLTEEHEAYTASIRIESMSIDELKTRQSGLNAVLNSMPGDSPLMEEYRAQLDQVNRRIEDIQGNADESRRYIEKMNDAFDKLRQTQSEYGEDSEQFRQQLESIRELSAAHDSYVDTIGFENLTIDELSNRQKELNEILRHIPGSSTMMSEYRSELEHVTTRIKELKTDADESRIYLDKMAAAFDKLRQTQLKYGTDSAEYRKQAEAIRKLTAEHDKYIDEIGFENLTVKELSARQRELNEILDNVPGSSEKLESYRAQLNQVKARIKELKHEAQETKFSLSKMADGINRYGAMAAGAVASLTGVALTARKCVDEFAEMQEAEAQVVKYTGMTADEVSALNDEFQKMDTRTARTRLNELAGDAGRLGIQGKQGVLDFVDAANMINVALGEDLGNDAVKNIGKLAEMFGDSGRSMKENMLAIASSVNEVAQNSSAAEPYLVEFTARMGGVAKQAGIAITDVMGFASALDQNMLRSEMASTALQNLVLKIYQEPAKYAKLAQMDVKEFTTTMATDANKAVLKFLEALGSKGGMAQVAPILKEMKLSGAEAAGVITTLAGNVAKVRKEQETANQAYKDGTSIINEFNVQNNTVQAELDKAKKRFADIRVELGEQLLPVMKYMVTTGSLTVKGLSSIISLLIKYKGTLTLVTAAVIAYTIAVNASNIADKAKVLWTDRILVSMRKLFMLIKSHPYVALGTAILTVVSLYKDWTKASDKLTASEKNLRAVRQQSQSDIRSEKAEIEQLVAMAKDENRSKETRLAAVRRLNEISPEYLGNLTLEKIGTEDATKAVNAYIDSLLVKQNIENANLRKNDLLANRDDILNNGVNEGRWTEVWNGFLYGTANAVNQGKQMLLGFEDDWAKETMNKLENRTVDKLKDIDSQVKDLDAYIEEQRQQMIEIQRQEIVTPSGVDKKKLEAAYEKELEALQLAQRTEQNLVKQAQFEGLKTEEEAQQDLYEIDVKYLSLRKKLLDDFNKDSSDIQGQLLDKMIAESNRRFKLLQEEDKKHQIQELPSPEEEEIDEDNYLIEKYKKTLDGQQALLDAQRSANLISEEEYQDRISDIILQKSEERAEKQKAILQTVSDVAGGFSDLFAAMQDSEISKVERKYDKEIAAAKKAGKDTTELEEEKEEAINSVKKKYADKQFAATVLQVTATTAVTAMEAYKAMAGIPVIGPALGAAAAAAAIASGAAQIAVAKQQRDEAKGLKSGGYSDDYVQGYTTVGNPDDVAGVIPVHKNEFVTNHEGVSNPHVRQFLDVFDMAQKRGTIRMLNTTQILEQVRTKSGYYTGGYSNETSGTSSGTSAVAETGVIVLLNRIIELLDKGNTSLKDIAGKELMIDVRTVRDGIRKLEKLEKNVSR